MTAPRSPQLTRVITFFETITPASTEHIDALYSADAFFKDPAGLSKWFVDKAFNDGLNVEQQQFQGTTQVKYMADAVTAEKGIFWVNPKTWEETAANTVAMGAAKAVPDLTTILTNDIMVKAALSKH